MANLFQMETVKYVCCCGSTKPICSVYFCRHCLRLRCSYCVSHEVDSHFCGNCSENIPSAEAKLKRHRCNTCYDCPSCKQTLSIRATTSQVPSEQDPSVIVAKKLYYLVCGFCRWSSRDAGIPDGLSTSGPWAEPELAGAAQLDEIGEYFRMLGVREKSLKEKKYVHKSKFLAAGRHGLAHLLPKRFPVSTPEEMSKAIPPPTYLAPTLGDEDIEELPEEFFTDPLAVMKSTGVGQRLPQVETQPATESGLLPYHKHLLIKRSLRCRVCERNISKPEYSPVSIKFKIQLNAYYHTPQVRLISPLPELLLPGQKTRVLLRISNPTQFPTTIKFLPFAFVSLRREDDTLKTELALLGTESSTDSPAASLNTSVTQTIKEISVLPIRNENFTVNCHLLPPDAELILPPRDETSDFDDFADTPDFNDDPNFVTWRKANKAAVYLDVERIKGSNSADEDPLVFGFTIEYDYTNTVVALDNKGGSGPQKVRIQAHLLVSLNTGLPKEA